MRSIGLLRALPSPKLAENDNSGPRARDARIARAVVALEEAPAERWTVAKLAKMAGLSRAAFARRFVAELGVPPLRKLADVRMRRAEALLATTDASLAEIAAAVGYAHEFALSRAFRRHTGSPPGVYRRTARIGMESLAPRCLAA